MGEFKIVSRPWQPQDLIDDLQMMIDEEPDSYMNGKRTTLCMARDYLKEHFENPVRHGRWVMKETMIRSPYAKNAYCSECLEETGYAHNYCPNCGAKMDLKGEQKCLDLSAKRNF